MNDLEFLRHAVATLAYRASKTVADTSPDFGGFRCAAGVRSPAEIMAHMGDLFDWALSLADGQERWHDTGHIGWEEAVERFFKTLETFDRRLASGKPLSTAAEKLFQGPVADALTHVGQIATMRRLWGHPCKGENYFLAQIEVGRAGRGQATPVKEFD